MMTPSGWFRFLCRQSMLIGAMMALAMICMGQAPDMPTGVDKPAAYIMVVDHSGSMKQRTSGNKTRWQEMKERVIEFARRGALNESRVVLMIFSSRAADVEPLPFELNTPEDRERMVQQIERVPAPTGDTALYDTLALACEEAERLSLATPGRNIQVMLYSDGVDEGSIKWTRQSIQARFAQLMDLNKNIWVFQTPLAGSQEALNEGTNIVLGSDKSPLSVTVDPGSVMLKNLAASPTQEFALTLAVPPGASTLLKGNEVKLELSDANGAPLAATLTPAALPLTGGQTSITLQAKAGAFDPATEVAGQIRMIYPELPMHVLQGPDRIALAAQKAEPPKIYDVRPRDGDSFAARKEITFVANTMQGAQVLWDFGDGNSASGAEVRHAYDTAGDREVKVKVTSDPRQGTTERKLVVHVFDVGVAFDPLAPGLTVGNTVKLGVTARGAVQSYEWLIDGQPFGGSPRPDGKPGSVIDYVFERPGLHEFQVRYIAEKAGELLSDKRTITVAEAPRATILAPQDQTVVTLGTEVEFRAAVEGPVNAVEWVLTTADGGQTRELHRASTPVETQQGAKVALLRHRLEEASDVRSAVMTATPAAEVGASGVLGSSVALTFRPPNRAISIINPPHGAQIAFDRSVRFEARPEGAGVEHVEWVLKDGAGSELRRERVPVGQDGMAVLEHTVAEGSGVAKLDVSAYAVTGGSVSPEVVDSVAFDCAAPPRSVSILSPQDRSMQVLGETINYVAVVEGPISAVEWTLAADEGATTRMLHQVTTPVTRETTQPSSTFRYNLPEDSGVAAALVYAQAATAEGPVGGVMAQAGFALRPPERTLRIVSPSGGDVLFGENVDYAAEVTGTGIEAVAWRLVSEADGSVAAETSTPLTLGEDGVRRAKWTHTIPAAGKATEMRVEARGIAAEGAPVASMPTRAQRFKAKYPPFTGKLSAPPVAHFDQPATFTLTLSGPAKSITWDFGDGTQDTSGNATPSHRYQTYGRFPVWAVAHGPGDQGSARVDAFVTVEPIKPVAKLRVMSGGKPVERVKPGTVVELLDESTGDVTSRTLTMNDEPLSAGLASLALEERGDYVLRLSVESPPDPDGKTLTDSVLVTVRAKGTPNHLAFIAGVILLLLLLFILWIVFTGNQLRNYSMDIEPAESFTKPGYSDFAPFKSREDARYNWFTKKVTVPLSMDGVLRKFRGSWKDVSDDETLVVSRAPLGDGSGISIQYKGKDPAERHLKMLECRDSFQYFSLSNPKANEKVNARGWVRIITPEFSVGRLIPAGILFVAILVILGVVGWLYQLIYG